MTPEEFEEMLMRHEGRVFQQQNEAGDEGRVARDVRQRAEGHRLCVGIGADETGF